MELEPNPEITLIVQSIAERDKLAPISRREMWLMALAYVEGKLAGKKEEYLQENPTQP